LDRAFARWCFTVECDVATTDVAAIVDAAPILAGVA
jgi:hypothetical protein